MKSRSSWRAARAHARRRRAARRARGAGRSRRARPTSSRGTHLRTTMVALSPARSVTYTSSPSPRATRAPARRSGPSGHLNGHLRQRLGAADRRVADRIRGELLVGHDEPVVVAGADPGVGEADLLDDALRRPATSTSSPSRSGWLIAIRIPATTLPIVRWLAKPITSPITADDASTPPATARTCGITSSAEMTPRKTIAANDRAAQHAVAGQRPRVRGRAVRSASRRASRSATATTIIADRDQDALPEERTWCSIRPSRSVSGPAKPSLEPVPVLDGVLADVPAELDLLALAQRREVEQPEVEVLDDDAELVEPLDAGDRAPRRAPRARPAPRSGRSPRSRRRCRRSRSRASPCVCSSSRMRAAQRDEALGDGAHLGEGAVSLGGSEEAIGHGAGPS